MELVRQSPKPGRSCRPRVRGGVWRALQWSGLIGFSLLAAVPPVTAAQPVIAHESELKAVFLFNFANFVEWPADAAPADAPFVIGILGDDPFGRRLDDVVAGEYVNGRPIRVERYPAATAVGRCEILYVARSESGRVPALLARLAHRPVLTVSDIPGFAEAGGMIGFATGGGRIRLNVNRAAVDAGGLEMNSKLLRVANVIGEGGQG